MRLRNRASIFSASSVQRICLVLFTKPRWKSLNAYPTSCVLPSKICWVSELNITHKVYIPNSAGMMRGKASKSKIPRIITKMRAHCLYFRTPIPATISGIENSIAVPTATLEMIPRTVIAVWSLEINPLPVKIADKQSAPIIEIIANTIFNHPTIFICVCIIFLSEKLDLSFVNNIRIIPGKVAKHQIR
jgi:hypothetical protein